MILSLPQTEFFDYIRARLNHFFPDGQDFRREQGEAAFHLALDRTEYSFSRTSIRGYTDGRGNAMFSHLHSDQYSQFLYYFANSMWNLTENRPVCDKLILLNVGVCRMRHKRRF